MRSVWTQQGMGIPKCKAFHKVPDISSPSMSVLDVMYPAQTAKMFCQTSFINIWRTEVKYLCWVTADLDLLKNKFITVIGRKSLGGFLVGFFFGSRGFVCLYVFPNVSARSVTRYDFFFQAALYTIENVNYYNVIFAYIDLAIWWVSCCVFFFNWDTRGTCETDTSSFHVIFILR